MAYPNRLSLIPGCENTDRVCGESVINPQQNVEELSKDCLIEDNSFEDSHFKFTSALKNKKAEFIDLSSNEFKFTKEDEEKVQRFHHEYISSFDRDKRAGMEFQAREGKKRAHLWKHQRRLLESDDGKEVMVLQPSPSAGFGSMDYSGVHELSIYRAKTNDVVYKSVNGTIYSIPNDKHMRAVVLDETGMCHICGILPAIHECEVCKKKMYCDGFMCKYWFDANGTHKLVCNIK